MPKISRRLFLSATAAALFTSPSRASEWQMQFDGTLSSSTFAGYGKPLLSQETAELTRRTATRYRTIAREGGWPSYEWPGGLRLGMRRREVPFLRRRLLLTGDLKSRGGDRYAYDSYVAAAVRRYQARNGLKTDGVAGPQTLVAMNVPATSRASSLEANARKIADGIVSERRYVTVNIPAAEIDMVEDDRIVLKQAAIVGKPDRPTPILTSAIHQINFNPYWTVPKSIIRKDLIPTIRRDPAYLDRMNMRIFDSNWKEVDPTSIDWSTNEAERYIFRQDPGAENALGRVRVNFSNKYSVYLHDTPNPTLFGDASRFHSSGCVRVERIPDFITWLLKDTPGWGRKRIKRYLHNGKRHDVELAHPVPVHFVYITSWSTEKEANFRPDIYGKYFDS